MAIKKKMFWCGKKVFITGHTGFKGSWLSLWLKLLGAEIVGYALPAADNSHLFHSAKIGNGIESIEGNILDLAKLKKTIHTQQPEIIFHLAAQPIVSYSYENPLETYQVNIIGTANLLEIIRSCKSVRAVIVVTSDKCYENQEWEWGYRETDRLGGFDPYSSSKGCAELVVSSYRRSFFNLAHYQEHRVGIATVRAGNVIGGGDWGVSRLIPDLIRAIAKKEIALLRNPHAYRPWQYILDLLQGYLILAEKLYEDGIRYSGAWNFGPQDANSKSVAWIADQLTTFFPGAKWKADKKKHAHEAAILKLDSHRARSLLNWQPQKTMDHLLKETLEWYQAYFQGENMQIFTEQQLKTYVQ